LPLKELFLKDFILVKDARIEFSTGFNVLTGETGAGKSMLISAMLFLGGADVDWEVFSGQRDEAVVEALFTGRGETLRVKRIINPEKRRTRAEINGSYATKSALRERIMPLFEIHGQHENELLLDPETHLSFLDRSLGLSCLRDKVRALFEEKEELENELRKRRKDMERLRQIRMLKEYQLEELRRAELREGEVEELEEAIERLSHVEALKEGINRVLDLLYRDDHSAYNKAHAASRILEDLGRFDRTLRPIIESLRGYGAAIEDSWRELVAYEERLEYDPEELENMRARLSFLRELEKKYGKSVDELLRLREELEEELKTFEEELDTAELEEEIKRVGGMFEEKARLLSRLRREKSPDFSREVENKLGRLGFGKVRFVVDLRETEPGPWGLERALFLFSANPGREPLPINKIASGGELSRLMLALRGMLVNDDFEGVLIFDEIDQGIGGRVAQVVGSELRKLASRHQVVVVTHLPQIAAFGERHFLVRKIAGEQTYTEVKELEGDDRVDEIARMLAGERITESSRLHALSLLEEAG